MRGLAVRQATMLLTMTPSNLVPPDHPIRGLSVAAPARPEHHPGGLP